MGVYAPEDYVIYITILFVILWLLRTYFFSRFKLDKDLIYAIIPYIPVGIFIRLLVDVGALEKSHLWNVTPGVYITTIILVLISLAVSSYLSRILKIPYFRISFGLGILLLLPLSYQLFSHMTHPERIIYPLAMSTGILVIVYLTSKYFKISILHDKVNLAIVFSHLLDGCATFIAYNYYGFYEEHLLPIYLISLAGDNAFIMVPVKLSLILIVVYLIEKWNLEDKEQDKIFYKMVKFLLFILGAGPGLRDTLLPALV